MNNEFIPYEQALELKYIGFNEPCFGYYLDNGEWVPASSSNWGEDPLYPTNSDLLAEDISAPTYSQAFRWFREKHLLLGYTTTGFCPFKDKPKSKSGFRGFICGIDIRSLSSSDNFFKEIQTNCYETYEEAELACLKKLIEIVKNK